VLLSWKELRFAGKTKKKMKSLVPCNKN